MTITLKPVFPGDLITADWMNDVLATIATLDARLAQLEAKGTGAAPFVNDLPSEITVPGRLTIKGGNFLTPATANSVMIDGQLFTDFKLGTSDTALVVDLPAGFGVLPRDVLVTVLNRNGSSVPRTLHLTAFAQIPDGQTHARNTTGALPAPAVGDVINYQFGLTAETNLAETYDLDLVFRNATPASVTEADWLARAEIVGDAAPTVNPNETLTVNVRVTVPDKAKHVELLLRATSRHNPAALNTVSDAVAIDVGVVPETPDDRITFTLTDQGPLAPSDGADGLVLHTDQAFEMSLQFVPKLAGDYSIKVKPATATPDLALQSNLAAGADTETFITIPALNVGAAITLQVTVAKVKADGSEQFHVTKSIPIRRA